MDHKRETGRPAQGAETVIHTQSILRCDGCRVAFLPPAESRNSDRHNLAIKALQDRARRAGWARYRPTPTGGIGDYCPHCQHAHGKIRERHAARKGQAA